MLHTLLKIGEWQSQGKSEWDRFLDYPKAEREDKRGNPIKNYTLPIIFDLDAKEVIISQENLSEYDEEKIKDTFPLKVKGGNNKAIYTSVPAKKINQIFKTFFGKEGSDAKNGELMESIEKTNHYLLTEDLRNLLSQVFELKDKFLDLTVHQSKGEVDIRAINEAFKATYYNWYFCRRS